MNWFETNWIGFQMVKLFIVKWNHIAIIFISYIVLYRVQSIQINANKWLKIEYRHVVWSVESRDDGFCFFLYFPFKSLEIGIRIFFIHLFFLCCLLFMLLISFKAFLIFMDMIIIHYYEWSIFIWLLTITIDSVIHLFLNQFLWCVQIDWICFSFFFLSPYISVGGMVCVFHRPMKIIFILLHGT